MTEIATEELSLLLERVQRARDQQSQIRRYLRRLRKKKPRQLDTLVHALHEEVFAHTDCLSCANCCKTISPVFTDQDIQRIARHLRMKPSEFVDTYLKLDEEHDYVLQQSPCAFLAPDNSCLIYEHRPRACRQYPHTDRRNFHKYLSLTAKNALVCPAAAEIVERMQEKV